MSLTSRFTDVIEDMSVTGPQPRHCRLHHCLLQSDHLEPQMGPGRTTIMLWRLITGTQNTVSDHPNTFHTELMLPGLNCLSGCAKTRRSICSQLQHDIGHQTGPVWGDTSHETEKVLPKRPKRKSAADSISAQSQGTCDYPLFNLSPETLGVWEMNCG